MNSIAAWIVVIICAHHAIILYDSTDIPFTTAPAVLIRIGVTDAKCTFKISLPTATDAAPISVTVVQQIANAIVATAVQ
jgi:hypothetical protein